MSSYNSKLKFKEFSQNSHYLRVDEKHPLELRIGLNSKGQKTLSFIGDFERVQVKSTKSIEVKHFIISSNTSISFSLINDEYTDLFYLFCDDIIDSSRNSIQSKGYSYILNRYEKWKGFSNTSRKFLSENEIRGLLAELIFLRDIIFDKYGISNGIIGWTGPEPTKKDFSFDMTWFEIKSVTKDIVTISSIEQLDSDDIGYLILYYFEKMSPEAKGCNLNQIVDEILLSIILDQDRANFIMKLVQIGYYKEDYYNDFVYKLSKVDYYEVNETFPRINRMSLDGAISNARYDLIINMLENYRRESI